MKKRAMTTAAIAIALFLFVACEKETMEPTRDQGKTRAPRDKGTIKVDQVIHPKKPHIIIPQNHL
jgi:hypothetical protein